MKLANLQNTTTPSGQDYYHEVDRDSDTLLIAVGDSWTWGQSLGKTTATFDDREYRTQHIYGSIIAKKLGLDFINLGFPGLDNFYALNHLLDTLVNLTKTYKKCYIIFCMTESGRELINGFFEQQDHYNSIRGQSWPTVNEILSRTASSASIEYARKEMIEKNIKFIQHFDLMLELLSAEDVNDFFIRYERFTLELIKQKLSQFSESIVWLVARSFTTIRKENSNLLPESNLTTTTWVDVISSRGSLSSYPYPVDVLSKVGLDPIIKISSVLGLDRFKEQWVEVFDQSMAAMNWLKNSPYNSHNTSCHPLEQAHEWWAEFLLEKLK